MKTYGKIEFLMRDKAWLVQCEPHVALRLKRVFAQLNKGSHGQHVFSDKPEFCHDMLWFMDRYPLSIKAMERSYMDNQSRRYKDRITLVDKLVAGLMKPRSFEMLLPARDYQRIAAEIALSTGGLLLADDVGLGKTATAI